MWVNSVSFIKFFAITCCAFHHSSNAQGSLSDYGITCKDENGQNVDWFVFFELNIWLLYSFWNGFVFLIGFICTNCLVNMKTHGNIKEDVDIFT